MPKKVLVLTYWGYKESLISSFTLPYLKALHEVNSDMPMHLFTLNKRHQQLSAQEIEQANKDLSAFNTQLLAFNYNRFGLKAMFGMLFLIFKLLRLIRKEKITHIHAFCTPAGAIGYILKLFARKVVLVLDSYEPHAESMVESGAWKEGGMAHKILFYLEKKQSKSADHIISLTEGMRAYAKKTYGVTTENFYVKPSSIDVTKFNKLEYIKHPEFVKRLKVEGKIVGLYAGKFGGLYLEDEIFDLIKIAFDTWGANFHMIILGGTADAYIQEKCAARNIPIEQISKAFVSEEELPYYLGLADFALTPVKPIPSKRYCSPIKNGEYWTLGLPVIITKNISDDSDMIRERNIGYVLDTLETSTYQDAVNWIDAFLKRSDLDTVKANIRALGISHRSMDRAKTVYAKIYTN